VYKVGYIEDVTEQTHSDAATYMCCYVAECAKHLAEDLQTAFRLLPDVDAFIKKQECSSAGELPCQMLHCSALIAFAPGISWKEAVLQLGLLTDLAARRLLL